MMDTNGNNDRSPLRKLALAMIAGGVAGFATMVAVSELTSIDSLSGLSRAADAAILVGAFYVLIAVGVGLGTLRPNIGSKILNVEDAEEVEEQKGMLLKSAIGMTLWGVALIIVALGGSGGVIAGAPAFIGAAVALVIGSYSAWLSFRCSDELMKAVNTEGTVVAYVLTFAVIGGWAMAAHLELVRPQEPIEALTVFYIVVLLATLVAAGRRGMLQPR